jgi:hypothetical protein
MPVMWLGLLKMFAPIPCRCAVSLHRRDRVAEQAQSRARIERSHDPTFVPVLFLLIP